MEYIKEFEETYIKDIFDNYEYYYKNHKAHEGYLINLNSYKELKSKLNNYYSSYRNISLKDTLKSINKLKDIEYKTSTFLINMLFIGKKYIIINRSLWNLFGDKNENSSAIYYFIEKNFIRFSFKDNKELKFICFNKDNNIEISSFSSLYNRNYQNFQENFNCIKSILEYNKIEKQILLNMQKVQKQREYGYLIDLDWLKKWMDKTNYQKIKENFPNSNYENTIIELLIFTEEILGMKQFNLPKLETRSFKIKNEMENFLESNSLAIVNSKFLMCFNGDYNVDDMISLDIFNNTIELYVKGCGINIKSNSNIITLKKNITETQNDKNELIHIHLKILIKIFNFQEELKSRINSDYNEMNNLKNEVYYINGEWIKRYKDFFNFPFLSNLLISSPEDTHGNYNDIENQYENLILLLKNSNNVKYLYDLNTKLSSGQLLLNQEYYNYKLNIFNFEKISIKYLEDFEILNEDIISIFQKNGLIKKEKLLKGKYIAGEKKIFFCFINLNKNYFQINSFDFNSNKFIIEYVIESELNHFLFNYFREKGINALITTLKNNTIFLGNEPICNCYQVVKEVSHEYNIAIDSHDNDQISEFDSKILYLLFLFSLFQMNIKSKISKFESQMIFDQNMTVPPIYNFYLVNKSIIEEFLNYFWDEKINEIISRYNLNANIDIDDETFKKILNDKDLDGVIKAINDKKFIFKEKVNDIDIFNIESTSIYENGELLIYPKDFIFLDKSLIAAFLKTFEINLNKFKGNEAEIIVTFNYGNIIFKSGSINFLNNEKQLIYIYSLDKNSKRELNFNLDIILSFKYYTDILNNNFNDIIKTNIFHNCLKMANEFEKKYSLKIHLLNKKVKEELVEFEDENKLTKFVNILAELYKEYLNLKIRINSSISDSARLYLIDEDYYLINKNYINQLEDVIHFKDIIKIISNYNQFSTEFEHDKKNCINKLKNFLGDEVKKEIIKLKNISTFEKFKNVKDYELKRINYKSQFLYYYSDSMIINGQIKMILTNFTMSILHIIEPVKCEFDKNKIFIKFNEFIAVGHIENQHHLTFDYLVQPKFQKLLNIIFDKIKQEGYHLIQKNLPNHKISFTYHYGSLNNYCDVNADIYEINKPMNNIQIQNYEISENLKKLILLYLEVQNNSLPLNSNNKLADEVYLINTQILSNPCFNEIELLLRNNNDILILLNKFNFIPNGLNQNQLDEILSKINIDQLRNLEQKYSKIKFQKIFPKEQKIILKNRKEVSIYREFIMIRKIIFNDIYMELGLDNIPNVYYTKINDEDIIIDTKLEYLSIGKKDNNYYFSLNYILIFKYDKNLKEDLKYIKLYGLGNYLENKTIFNKELKNDIISPIFSRNEEIGTCYRIIYPGMNNFSDKKDYSDYINSSNFQKAYNLYNFYEKIKEKKNLSYSQEKEYYLINKKSMSKIRKLYKYKDIKATIEKINPNEIKKGNQMKILLYILKFLPEDTFENFIKEEIDIEKMEKNEMEPEIEPVYTNDMNKNNSSPLAMIYKNFEIIDPSITKSFFHGIKIDRSYLDFDSKDNNLMKCILKDGKVMINYEKNYFGNNKDVVVIGTLNDDNTFINEYVLIYEQYYISHFNNLKQVNLNKYLSQIQFFNDSSPIVINQYVDIGKIIRLQSAPNNNNNYNYPMFVEEQAQNNDIPYDSNYGKKDNKTDISSGFNREKYDKKNYSYINEAEYNLDSKTNVTSIKQYFPYPPLIGLDNIGATCYMNATLQCLCNIEKFVDYFKYNPHLINTVKNDKDKSKLCSSFKLLIEKVWPDKEEKTNSIKNSFFPLSIFNTYESEGSFNSNKKNKSIPPEEFKKKISKMNPLFKGVAANDAKDLVQFLIMTLHEELNKAQKKIVNNTINNDQRNKQLMFQVFAQDFMTSNISMISDLFYGVNYNIIQCGNCGVQSFNYQTYFFLVFPLEEVRIFKSQNNLNYNYNYFNNNEVNIYDCFFYDQKINFMSGSNNMYCNFCRQTCNSSMRTFLTTGPEILIIILNRGQGIQFNVKINFLEEINLENFIEMKQTGCIYNLIGVITHLGESGMGGHFIAYCKNPISQQWHKYNDSIVSQVENFKSEVIDFAMPYLLFYQKKI